MKRKQEKTKTILKAKQNLPIKKFEKEIKRKHLLLSVFIGLSSVSAATEEPIKDEKISIFEAGQALSKQEKYDESNLILQTLAQDNQVQQRKHLLYAVLFYLATNYECMFIRELGSAEQQRENINKAIEYFEQIIHEIGVLPDCEYTLERASPRLRLAQEEKSEFELRQAAAK